MKIRLLTSIVIVMLGSSTLQSCFMVDHVIPTDTQAQLQQLTDSLYRSFQQKWPIEQNKGGFFLLVKNPAGSFLVSTNIEPQVQLNTHFRMASISKNFTAAAIMLLVQNGKIALSDPIANYLPDAPAYNIPYKQQITIRQLLQHRGGVFDVTNQVIPTTVMQPYAGKSYSGYVREELQQDTHTFTFDELIGVVAENNLSNFAPGTAFGYSNTGYNLLGKLIEKVSGMSYSDFIRTQFLEPLQLNDTYGVWDGSQKRIRDPFVESYAYVPDLSPINTTEDNMSIHVSAGDMVSTPADVTRWIELLLTGKAGISPQNVALMKEMEVAGGTHALYGLGLVFTEGTGYGHDGALLSYLSNVRYNPANKTTVLMVGNFFKVGSPAEADLLELVVSIQKTTERAVRIVNH